MVSWLWIPVSAIFGCIVGVFLIALFEANKEPHALAPVCTSTTFDNAPHASKNGNYCVVCGEEIPEGRLICPKCESIY